MARESVKILQGKLDVESLISQLNSKNMRKKNADMRNCLPTALSNWKEYPYWTRRNGSNWQDANMMLPKGLIL